MSNSVPKLIIRKTRWWNSKWFDVLQLFVFLLGLVWVTFNGANQMGYNWQWYRIPQYFYGIINGDFYFGPLIEGLFVTMEITACSIFITLLVGLTTAILRMSNSLSGRLLSWLYLEIVRNTPLLVQMFVFYFVLGPILNLDRFWVGVLCISLFEGSFASEIIRAGILSVVKGQWEVSYSIGLTKADTYRYVVLPQALPLMLPPLTGVIINLIKHSAIVSVIAVFELTTQALDLIAETFMSFEIWLSVSGIYLVMTITISVLVSFLEQWVRQRS